MVFILAGGLDLMSSNMKCLTDKKGKFWMMIEKFKKKTSPKPLCKLTEKSNNNNFPLRTQLSGHGKVSWQQTLKQ